MLIPWLGTYQKLQQQLADPELLLALFTIFVILNVLDGHSTWQVLKPDHFHRERNPLARWIFRKLGIPRGIVIFKIVLLFVLALAFYIYSRTEILTLNVVLLVANIVFLLVVVHNYKVTQRIRGRR